MGNYGIGVPMNVRCEGTIVLIVLYHRNSIRGDTVGVFHAIHNYCNYCGSNSTRQKASKVIKPKLLTETEDLNKKAEAVNCHQLK